MKHGILNHGVWIKKEKEADKLRLAGGAWSINLAELPDNAYVIKYKTERETYRITRVQAYEHGFIRYFQGEEKLIVPIKYWIKQGDFTNES